MFEVSHDDISRILHEFLFLSSLDIMLEILLGYLHILWVIWVYPSCIKIEAGFHLLWFVDFIDSQTIC